jgi:myotubularin-related protein 14
MCLHLLARDYIIQTVDNSDGRLCPHYPAHLFILEGHVSGDNRKFNDARQLGELFKAAKLARSLCRFPVPVILLDNKNICRSSTLSTAVELYGRTGFDWFFSNKSRSAVPEMEHVPRQLEKRPSLVVYLYMLQLV